VRIAVTGCFARLCSQAPSTVKKNTHAGKHNSTHYFDWPAAGQCGNIRPEDLIELEKCAIKKGYFFHRTTERLRILL